MKNARSLLVLIILPLMITAGSQACAAIKGEEDVPAPFFPLLWSLYGDKVRMLHHASGVQGGALKFISKSIPNGLPGHVLRSGAIRIGSFLL